MLCLGSNLLAGYDFLASCLAAFDIPGFDLPGFDLLNFDLLDFLDFSLFHLYLRLLYRCKSATVWQVIGVVASGGPSFSRKEVDVED
jgi:hypothetical protein